MELKISKLIEKHLRKLNSEPDKRDIERYELVRAVLDSPEKRPSAFVQQIEKELGYPPLISVKYELNSNNLGMRSRSRPEEQRVEWVRDIRQIGNNLSRFAQEGTDDYKVLHSNITQTFNKIRSRRMNSKAILHIFCDALPNDVNYKDPLNELIPFTTFMQAKTLLHELIDLIAIERGLSEQKFQKERVTDSSTLKTEVSPQSTPESNTARQTTHKETFEKEDSATATEPSLSPLEALENSPEQIADEASQIEAAKLFQEMTAKMEHLEQENATLHTGSQIAEHRVQVLQEQLMQTQTEAERNAVTSFFREMNSVRHSSLLDQFLKVEKLIERLHQLETEIPEELELLPTLVDMFSQFLEMQGIAAKYDVGSRREITLNESDQYEYFGSQFENEDERKTVEVLSSGWTYEGELIIKPRVREIV
ncbi:MAG: hypothetical protein OXU23_27405 [Candidatus Poribacteria bacterium]|nr:hypothetical protein [Candidatus Poribacteria bacterium]